LTFGLANDRPHATRGPSARSAAVFSAGTTGERKAASVGKVSVPWWQTDGHNTNAVSAPGRSRCMGLALVAYPPLTTHTHTHPHTAALSPRQRLRVATRRIQPSFLTSPSASTWPSWICSSTSRCVSGAPRAPRTLSLGPTAHSWCNAHFYQRHHYHRQRETLADITSTRARPHPHTPTRPHNVAADASFATRFAANQVMLLVLLRQNKMSQRLNAHVLCLATGCLAACRLIRRRSSGSGTRPRRRTANSTCNSSSSCARASVDCTEKKTPCFTDSSGFTCHWHLGQM